MKGGSGRASTTQNSLSCLGLSFVTGPLGGSWGNPVPHNAYSIWKLWPGPLPGDFLPSSPSPTPLPHPISPSKITFVLLKLPEKSVGKETKS